MEESQSLKEVSEDEAGFGKASGTGTGINGGGEGERSTGGSF